MHLEYITITTPKLKIKFDNKTGLPSEYELTELQDYFSGADPDFIQSKYMVVLKHAVTKELASVFAHLNQIELISHTARVHYDLAVDEVHAGSFVLQYTIEDTSVLVTLEDVEEEGGYEVIEIQTPSLITLNQAEGNPWIAHGDGGGYWVDLASANESNLAYGERGEFPNFSVLPLVLLGKDRAAVAMEVQGYMSNTAFNIYEKNNGKTVTMGVITLYRVPGGATTPNISVEQKEVARFDFVGDYDGNGHVDWLDVAKFVKDRMPPKTTDYYDDKFMYAVDGQVGPTDLTEPRNTFGDTEEIIKRISMLIDGNPQVVFMAGWPDGGHDTGYPNVEVVNPYLGGKEGWDKLQQNARDLYNTNVSLDDNYDDQYNNKYTENVFDEAYITINQAGDLERHNAWNGVDLSYITGFAKYMEEGGPGLKRARFTIDYYGLQDAMLIDAMSWWSIRNDWDRDQPASAVKNLKAGKFKLLDEFAKNGVYVGSELLRYPFVGKLAFTMDGPEGEGWNEFGGTPIPLMSLVYRHTLIYGSSGGENTHYPDPKVVLFHNNRSGKWIGKETPDETITGYYYMHYLPWMRLHDLNIETFQRNNSTVTIGLDENSSIFIDYSNNQLIVTYKGIEIMNGSSVTIPMDHNRIAFYSDTARTLSYPLLKDANANAIKAKKITSSEYYEHPFTVSKGTILVDVPPKTPIIVYL